MATLEQLEGEDWGEPNFSSHLVTTCHRLRRKHIEDFTVEDLRIMIGQSIGLRHLAPRAVAMLESDPFAQGDFFPGDLLSALLRPDNWSDLAGLKPRIDGICRTVLAALKTGPDEEVALTDDRTISPARSKTLWAEITAYLNH